MNTINPTNSHAEVSTTDIPTVYVIDDQENERESIAAITSTEGWDCVGFQSAEDFFAAVIKKRPGCLVLDYRLESEDGLQVLRRMNEQADALPTLVITAYADVPITTEFMRRGAITLLQKPYSQSELISNIRTALEQDHDSRELKNRMTIMEQISKQVTERQQKVIDLVLQGDLNKHIATKLGVSQRTIENERASILELYEVNNAVELATKITEYRSYLASRKTAQRPN